MSDISNSSSFYSSSKRRLNQIDDAIEYLTQEVNSLNDFAYKTEFQCSLMTVKMKREKVKALSAFAKSQVLLTDMEIMIAEGDLFTDVERLRNFKKIKLEREEGQSQKHVEETNSKSSQTTKSKTDKNKHKHSSSKSSVDISTDETVLIPTETSQIAKTSFSLDLFSKSPAESDSEISLSSSIKAAFNEPYSKTPIKKSPAKKTKTDKKSKSKRTASNIDRPQTQTDPRKSINMSPNIQNSQASTANNSRTGEPKITASNSYVPIRHNIPAVLTQPSTSTSTPLIYVNPTTQTNMLYHSQKAGSSHTFTFYGSKQ